VHAGSGEILVVFVTRASSGVGRRLESLLARLQLQQGLRVHTVDADARPELLARLKVEQVPSIVIVADMRPVRWLTGRVTYAQLEEALASHGWRRPAGR